jgi:hypothetical protein
MLRIDNGLLEEVGLANLPDAEKNSLLKHVYETLEMRVGVRLADQMSNEQLDEFERYFEAKDDAGAFQWLETNFPNYKEIVQEEFDKLKSEVTQSAPQILASSQAQPTTAPQDSSTQAPPASASVPQQQQQQQPPQSANFTAGPQAQAQSPQPAPPSGSNYQQSPPPAYQQQQQPSVSTANPQQQPYYEPQPPQQPPTNVQPPYPSEQPPAGPSPS